MSEQDNSGASLESTETDVADFSKYLYPEAEATEEVAEATEEEAEPSEEVEPSPTVTIEVDGKTIELNQAQIAEVYKNGLRQADYTRKTMETAEQRKVAEAETAKTIAERTDYQTKLQTYTAQLEGALNEQSQIDWQKLIDNDPVEYLKQQHLYNQRQAALNQTKYEQQRVGQAQQEYEANRYAEYLQAQEQQLVATLPAWKDSQKANAEKAEIRGFLVEQGFTDDDISQVTDFRHVLLLRDAMQFRKLLKEAPGATKKVTQAPLRVERAGVAQQAPNKSREAMTRFGKSGRDSDAIAAFASLL